MWQDTSASVLEPGILNNARRATDDDMLAHISPPGRCASFSLASISRTVVRPEGQALRSPQLQYSKKLFQINRQKTQKSVFLLICYLFLIFDR
jgi:hypothetical protein